MRWDALYDQGNQPTEEDIGEFIGNPLWQEVNSFLKETYGVSPKLTYSKCSMQRGWNVKYQKSGRALCTLYPMEGYFIALVVIGEKEKVEAELLVPLCGAYIQKLYQDTVFSVGGKWLMIRVDSEEVLNDTKNFIQLRIKPSKK